MWSSGCGAVWRVDGDGHRLATPWRWSLLAVAFVVCADQIAVALNISQNGFDVVQANWTRASRLPRRRWRLIVCQPH
jgi:hypothetical protein